MNKKEVISDIELKEIVNFYKKFSNNLVCLNRLKDDLSRKYDLERGSNNFFMQ